MFHSVMDICVALHTERTKQKMVLKLQSPWASSSIQAKLSYHKASTWTQLKENAMLLKTASSQPIMSKINPPKHIHENA